MDGMMDCIMSFSRCAKLIANRIEKSVLSLVVVCSILNFDFGRFPAKDCVLTYLTPMIVADFSRCTDYAVARDEVCHGVLSDCCADSPVCTGIVNSGCNIP